MKAIWKAILQITDFQPVRVKKDVRFLHAAMQGDDICLWFEVSPGAPDDERMIGIVGTGNPLPDRCHTYIDSVHMPVAPGVVAVWHIYEAAFD